MHYKKNTENCTKEIVDQKRCSMEQNEAILQLKKATVEYSKRLGKQKDMVDQLASTINVAFQDYVEVASCGLEERLSCAAHLGTCMGGGRRRL